MFGSTEPATRPERRVNASLRLIIGHQPLRHRSLVFNGKIKLKSEKNEESIAAGKEASLRRRSQEEEEEEEEEEEGR